MKTFIALVLLIAATPALAQVGYEPERSPFRDVRHSQSLTLFAGYFAARTDPAGVAPQSAPMLGLRYEVRLGGPAQLLARAGTAFSERRVVDPTLIGDARELGRESWPVYLADVGIALSLTGQKSWHNLVPMVQGSIGVASDLRGSADVGGYKFGTTFALTLGGGVRWVRERLEFRADLTDYLYQIRYPDSYYVQPPGGSPLLPSTQSTNLWTHNVALTLGASYALFR